MLDITRLQKIYGSDKNQIEYQKARYQSLYKKYSELFGEAENVFYFSAPGRTELCGNHTDHNGGKVLAAAINLDTIACVMPNDEGIEIYSEGFDEKISVDINFLDPLEKENGTSAALVRGIVSDFQKRGYKIGGFKGVITSNVLVGSGLSSSASFEVLIGEILNYFYNDDKIAMDIIARIGQFAENNFFGKPCGLMDQVACAVGGVVAIDFADAELPNIEKIYFDLHEYNYKLLVVNTGSSHHNLTNDYAAIPNEMKSVAAYFKKENCSQIDFAEFKKHIPALYSTLSHRAVLRAFHFFKENLRVDEQVKALKANELERFLQIVKESGNSSFKYLQNIYSTDAINEQSLSIALALTEDFLHHKGIGACRVHGGGFAGTIQVFLPSENVNDYKILVESLFGENALKVLDIRKFGAVVI